MQIEKDKGKKRFFKDRVCVVRYDVDEVAEKEGERYEPKIEEKSSVFLSDDS